MNNPEGKAEGKSSMQLLIIREGLNHKTFVIESPTLSEEKFYIRSGIWHGSGGIIGVKSMPNWPPFFETHLRLGINLNVSMLKNVSNLVSK